MTIVFYDGSTLNCDEIEFFDNRVVIIDGYRVVTTTEIQRIVTAIEPDTSEPNALDNLFADSLAALDKLTTKGA